MPDTRARRRKLVEKLVEDGQIRSARVAAAFEAVPRELFVPGVPLDEVYRSSEAILIKRVDGVGVSSASAPDVMATMLELLHVEPGMRVLEIGAGTGYNAALLAHLVGENGSVVSIDIDADLVDAARAHLAQAGYQDRVEVVEADGALGYMAKAPYDCIMLTVASRDLAPAWRDQLAPDGRLLLPLSIRGPQRCVVFQNQQDHLTSRGVGGCSFIPLRGVLAMDPVRLPLDGEGALMVSVAGDVSPVSAAGVLTLLGIANETWSTGVRTTPDNVRQGLHVWLAGHDAAVCSFWAEANTRALPDLYGQMERVRGSLGLLDHDGLAVLAWSEQGELLVRWPPGSAALAGRLVGHVQSWSARGRPLDAALRIRAFDRAATPAIAPHDVVIDQRWTRFLLSWHPIF
jgi:protein-L-isoaspartate(D-aspartate) O-methyltransferase